MSMEAEVASKIDTLETVKWVIGALVTFGGMMFALVKWQAGIIGRNMADLKTDMTAGFAGVGDKFVRVHMRLDEFGKELTRVEKEVAYNQGLNDAKKGAGE